MIALGVVDERVLYAIALPRAVLQGLGKGTLGDSLSILTWIQPQLENRSQLGGEMAGTNERVDDYSF